MALQGIRNTLYEGDRMHAFDALQYSMGKLGTSLYLLEDTSPDRLDPQTDED